MSNHRPTSFHGSGHLDVEIDMANISDVEFADAVPARTDQDQVGEVMEEVFLDDDGSLDDTKKFRPSNAVTNLVVACAGILILIIVLATALGGGGGSDKESANDLSVPYSEANDSSDSTNPSEQYAPAGTTTYTRDPTVADDITQTLANQLGTTYFENALEISGFPYQVRQTALSWLLYEDPLQLQASDDNLLQRFILFLLYFSTTRTHAWAECNPPQPLPSDKNPLCYYPKGFPYGINGVWGHRWLSDVHECMWAGVLCDRETKVILDLRLIHNNLNGPIPYELIALTGLTRLTLSDNSLTGTIPPELADLRRMNGLNLEQNQLTGSIPKEIFSRGPVDVPLMFLNLGENQLIGSIPSEIGLMNGTSVYLDHNQLTGTLPKELFENKRFAWWNLNSNPKLTGTLPSELGIATRLRWIDLSFTSLTGPLPTEIGLLSTLREFNVTNTNLGGTLPEELYSVSDLAYLDMTNCQFSGTISTSIGGLQSLSWIHLADNHFSGTLPIEMTTLPDLRRMQFQGNNLSGSVPQQLCDQEHIEHAYGKFELIADCTPSAAATVECACCTSCCSSQTGTCT